MNTTEGEVSCGNMQFYFLLQHDRKAVFKQSFATQESPNLFSTISAIINKSKKRAFKTERFRGYDTHRQTAIKNGNKCAQIPIPFEGLEPYPLKSFIRKFS